MGKMNKSRKKKKRKKKRVKPLGHDHRQTTIPAFFFKPWRLLCLASWSKLGETSELGWWNVRAQKVKCQSSEGEMLELEGETLESSAWVCEERSWVVGVGSRREELSRQQRLVSWSVSRLVSWSIAIGELKCCNRRWWWFESKLVKLQNHREWVMYWRRWALIGNGWLLTELNRRRWELNWC